MTQEEVIQGNIAIHLFNGYDEIPKGHYHQMNPDLRYFGHMDQFGTVVELLSENDLEYHISWDWLMPVWRKCIDIIGLWAHTHEDDNKSKVWLKASDNIRVALTSADITKAHREISSLIQWYNTQTQQHGTTI
jgi:hypothetical protein